MITDSKDRISTVQATVTVASTIIGVGILTLPRTATEAMGTPDAWMAVLLGGMIAYILLYLQDLKFECWQSLFVLTYYIKLPLN